MTDTIQKQKPVEPELKQKRKNKKNKHHDESYYLASQWTLMYRKLMKHSLAKVSIVILLILYISALFANFIAPSDLVAYNAFTQNAPPTKLHMFHEGKLVGPFVYGLESEKDMQTFKTVFTENTEEIYKIKFFAKGPEYKLFGLIPTSIHLFEPEDGGYIFLFGTDSMGRDIFSRMLLGSQISLTIPFVGAFISFILGIVIGGISGYFGGILDVIIQRITEVLFSFPQIPLWMALAAAIPPNISVVNMYFYITVIISLISWTKLARVVRGRFISMRNEEYIMAAKLSGVSDGKIILKHMVPGFMSYLIVNITLEIPTMILGETSMSFLGLGIRAPATSWGVLLQEAKDISGIAAYPWRLIPLLAVVITVLAFNFLGDGLRDAADPYK